jgi:hypothetical protein
MIAPNLRIAALFMLVWGMGCSSAEGGPTEAAPMSTSSSRPSALRARSRKHGETRQLGPDERRVMVIVVPGDAQVEVDGQATSRRNGVVEIVGKPGEKHTLRAWKDDKSTELVPVTIEEAGANPAFVDVYEVKVAAKSTVAIKSKAARFNLDE